jgi:hypothetical protein
MKKIILFISLIFISFNSYSQKDPQQMGKEIAKYLFDMKNDPFEQRPIKIDSDSQESLAIRKYLTVELTKLESKE